MNNMKFVRLPVNRFYSNNFLKFNKSFFSFDNVKGPQEIHIKSTTVDQFYPIRGLPEFQNGLFTVFDNKQLDNKVPYLIKEYSTKGFLYTFFLIWGGRYIAAYSSAKIVSYSMFYSFIPAGVFSFFYGKIVWTMMNAVTTIRLKENGTHVILEFKNFLPSLEVEISRLKKVESETIYNECYFEPNLYPIDIDYEDVYGKFSFRSKRRVYLYSDSHESIRNGEIFRAIINGQNIRLK